MEEPTYDFSTSCLKDDAVRYLMGWPLQLLSIPEDASEQEWELYDVPLEILVQDWKESAESKYNDAKLEKLEEAVIAEKLAVLERCDFNIKQVHQYLCCIDDELAKGDASALRIDPVATVHPHYPYITLTSFAQWAKDRFQIDIFEPANHRSIVEPAPSDNSVKINSEDAESLNLQITFALLVEAYSKLGNMFRHSKGEKPNVNTIAKEIIHQVANRDTYKGPSLRSIIDRINDALSAKNMHHATQLSSAKLRNLQITLALLIEAFAGRGCGSCLAEIAKNISSYANGLPSQDQKTIEARFQKAMEVKNSR